MSIFFVNTQDAQISNAFIATLGAAPGSTYLGQVKAFGLIPSVQAMIAATNTTTVAALSTKVATNLGLTGVAKQGGEEYLTTVTFSGASSSWAGKLMETLNLFTGLANDPVYGAAAQSYLARVNSAVSYSSVATNNSTDLSTLAAAVGATGSTGTGSTFTLTVGADTLKGTSANDVFSGPIDSLTVLDSLDGGAGVDTLTVNTTQTAAAAGIKIVGIETINIATTGAGYTIDTTTFTDAKNLTVTAAAQGAVSVTAASTTEVNALGTTASAVTIIGGGGVVTATTGAAAVAIGGTLIANSLTNVTVTGGSTVGVEDRSGAAALTGSTLKTVTISKATDDQTLKGNGITTVNLTSLTAGDGLGDTTITAVAGTRELTVNYNGVDVGGDEAATAGTFTMTDAEATTLKINAVTKASFDVTAVVAKATSVAIDSSVALQLDALTAGVAKAVAISGAAKTTITANTLAADVVITSTSAGGVTLTQALGADQQYVGTGSTGVDTISVGATTKAITTGAGNDVITSAGLVGTGGSVDAGDGIDTIVMTTVEAEAADNSSVFNSKFKNFETLQISDALAATAVLVTAGINDVSTVVLAAGGGDAATAIIRNLKNDGTVQFNANTAGITVELKDALFNPTDTLNLAFKSATEATVGIVTAAGAETVKISAPDATTTTTAGGAAVKHVITALTAADATSIVVTGNNGLTITAATGSVKVTSFDASAVIGNGVSDTAANLAVTYASLNATATAAVSIKGGAGDDVLTGNAGKDTIVGGAGIDTITGGGNADIMTGGAGNDTFVFTTLAFTQGAGYLGTNTTAINIDHITDFVGNGAAAGDTIKFVATSVIATGVTLGAAGAEVSVGTVTAITVAEAGNFNEMTAGAQAVTGGTVSVTGNKGAVQLYDITVTAGTLAGRYLLVNDTTAALTSADTIINLTGITGALHANDFSFAA